MNEATPAEQVWCLQQQLAGAFLSSSAVLLGYYFGAVRDQQRGTAVMAMVKVPEAQVKSSAAPPHPLPATAPSLPAALPLNLPGFVLQVGAMRREENAHKLAEALRHRNFPASVFRRGGLYRVAVGPYSDADSTARVKDQLEKQGFKAILKHWFAKWGLQRSPTKTVVLWRRPMTSNCSVSEINHGTQRGRPVCVE